MIIKSAVYRASHFKQRNKGLSIAAISENKVSSIERKSFLTEKNGESKEVSTISAARDSFCRQNILCMV